MFGKGISQRRRYYLDLAVGLNIVNKSGAWFAYEGNKIGQGRENAKAFLADHPEVCDEIEPEGESALYCRSEAAGGRKKRIRERKGRKTARQNG